MPLIKADLNQCQAEKRIGFMQLGPPKITRCTNKPVYISKEKKPAKGYKNRGSMSLCERCKDVMLEQLGVNFATLKRI